MSETDSFIDEVTEEVRRDKLFAAFRKYGWIAVLIVVLVVGGAAWREWTKAQAEAAARRFGDAVSAAQAENDPTARLKALEAIATSGVANGDRGIVLNFLIASAAVEAKDQAAALTALDKVAKDPKAAVDFRDLAELKRVLVAGASLPDSERKAALEQLAAAGRPYRPLALEQLALGQVQAGDKAGAIKAFKELLQEPGLTGGLRQRATAMIIALGGDPAAS